MKNSITWSFRKPLGIYAVGTGEYIREQLTHLVDLFADAEAEHYEQLRQDNE